VKKPWLLLLPSFVFSAVAFAATTPGLFFEAGKNNLEILAQRFEYNLMDDDRLRIGDLLIDSNYVTFHLEPSATEKDHYQLRFTWPAGLLKEGDLSIKDSTGKAIFTASLDKKNIRLLKTKANTTDPTLRTEVASFLVPNVGPELFENIKYQPFVEFCIYKVTAETKVYLCSKELYLSTKSGTAQIKPRTTSKKAAFVEINNKPVGNQGLIYLNKKSEPVAFRARTQSGAFLEIETHRNEFDFKDVVQANKNENFLLTASGNDPIAGEKVTRLSSGDWQIELEKERPQVYLKAEGDVPVKQEFFVKGPLPSESLRPQLKADALTKSYSSEVTLQGQTPNGVQVSTVEKADHAELANNNGTFSWKVKHLTRGQTERRYLSVTDGKNQGVVGHDFYRARPYAIYLDASYFAPSSVGYLHGGAQWWLESFGFHWGLGVERLQHLNTKSGHPSFDLTTGEILWRADSGFYLEDASWGLVLPYQNVSLGDTSMGTVGFGGFWLAKNQSKELSKYWTWSELKLRYFFGSSGSSVKLNSGIDFSATAMLKLSNEWYLRYGLGLMDYQFDPSQDDQKTQVNFNVGVLWNF
jgi:hypothetical protein